MSAELHCSPADAARLVAENGRLRAELEKTREDFEDEKKCVLKTFEVVVKQRDAANTLLQEAHKRIYDCKYNAMFSSKGSIVKHIAELLPLIEKYLEKQ